MPGPEFRVSAQDAVYILDMLDAAGVELWVAGGWGVDALVGNQTREHRDLDVIVPMHKVLRVVEVMQSEGFRVAEDWFPVRFEMVDDRGRAVDIHPVRFDEEGNAYMEMIEGEPWRTPAAGLAGSGTIAGREVRCHSVQEQLRDHSGYEPDDKDRHDVALLTGHFDLDPPQAYAG